MISCYFGVPGVGKTCFLTSLAQKELKKISTGKSKYEWVATNFDCYGCVRIDYADLGNFRLDNTLILLDELVMDADNRNFKNFKPEIRDFFILHRHLGNDIIYATQSYELVDLKIRQLTADLWFLTQPVLFPFLTRAQKIYRTIAINEHTSDLTLGYRFCNRLEAIFKSNNRYCFRPKYYKFYDSFDSAALGIRPIFDYTIFDFKLEKRRKPFFIKLVSLPKKVFSFLHKFTHRKGK